MAHTDEQRLIEWLMANSGPVVRYLTATQLIGDLPPSERQQATAELLAAPIVQTWLGRLELGNPPETIDGRQVLALGARLHGSKNTLLENVLAKLMELGLRAGMPSLDERMRPLGPLLSAASGDDLFTNAWAHLVIGVLAGNWCRAGYPVSEVMQAIIRGHLAPVHRLAAERLFDIHAAESELVGLPKAWAGKPILKQEMISTYCLPSIHDMYLLAYYPHESADDAMRQITDDIVSYVLDPRFQALPYGYGYGWIKNKRTCYGWGWSPHLPGHAEFERNLYAAMFVQRLELMAHFPLARQSAWFQENMAHLETFRTERGTYAFPARYLPEQLAGYYVQGAYMGLGENRRARSGPEIESTLRMLRLKRWAAGNPAEHQIY